MLKKKQSEGREHVLKSRCLRNGSVTQKDFEKCLALRLNIPVADAHAFTAAFLEELKAWLLDGFRVKFRGFGAIGTRVIGGRTYYNSFAKKEITSERKRVVHFDQSLYFLEKLNANYNNIWQQYTDEKEKTDVLE